MLCYTSNKRVLVYLHLKSLEPTATALILELQVRTKNTLIHLNALAWAIRPVVQIEDSTQPTSCPKNSILNLQ